MNNHAMMSSDDPAMLAAFITREKNLHIYHTYIPKISINNR